jgi:putative ABC transport system substrate-binding protein
MRASLELVGLGLLSGCGLASRQPTPAAHPRIGYLAVGVAPKTSFRQVLRELGYSEGNNIAIEWRSAEGREDRLPDLANELASMSLDLIVTRSTPAALAARQATATVPIVMSGVEDPVGAGLVASLARPGGNVTGLTDTSAELALKRFQLLREASPAIARVLVLWGPGGARALQETTAAAGPLGVQVQSVELGRTEDFGLLGRPFEVETRRDADALLVTSDALIIRYQSLLVGFAARVGLPAMYAFRGAVEAGGLMAYVPNQLDLDRRTAAYVIRILKGAAPSDLPVEQPTRFDFVVNLKTAQSQGLTIPGTVLQQATEIIQ